MSKKNQDNEYVNPYETKKVPYNTYSPYGGQRQQQNINPQQNYYQQPNNLNNGQNYYQQPNNLNNGQNYYQQPNNLNNGQNYYQQPNNQYKKESKKGRASDLLFGAIALLVLIAIFGVSYFYAYNNWDYVGKILRDEKFNITFVVDEGVEVVCQSKFLQTPEYTGELKQSTDEYEYVFVKWNPEIKVTTNDATYTAVYKQYKKETINFIGTDYENPNTSYYLSGKSYTLENAEKLGYTFLGWYTEADGAGEKVTKISSSQQGSITLYPYFEIIEYTITYNYKYGNLGEGVTNPSKYTVLDSFTLNNPSKTGVEFKGWMLNGVESLILTYVVEAGTTGDLSFVAVYSDESIEVKYYYGDILLRTNVLDIGNTYEEPVFSDSELKLGGYKILGWYTDKEFTNKYTFSIVPANDLILYSQTEYVIDKGFYEYKAKFTSSEKSLTNPMKINSYEELVCWFEYVMFNYITEQYYIDLKFDGVTDDTINNAFKSSTMPSNTAISIGKSGLGYYSIYYSDSPKGSEAEQKFTGNSTVTQFDNGIQSNITSTRESTFDDFSVNNISNTIQVETSNQLVYALEKGLKPICKSGSDAETIYKLAKDVLRDICDDSMTNLQKTKAIYEWIITNTQYDTVALNYTGNDGYKYKSWYAEGVFIDKIAVCDGFAKAYLILNRIEGIPCIRVDGNQHAWNKVYIDGEWFVVDTTHGNLIVNDDELLTYKQFLITDSYKASLGDSNGNYITTDYTDCVADSEYNFFEDYTFGSNLDLTVSGKVDMENIIKYAISNLGLKTGDQVEIDFAFEENSVLSYSEVIKKMGNLISSHSDLSSYTSSSGYTIYTTIITIK